MTQFTSRVSSGGLLNIPSHVEEMNEYEQDDLLEVRVVKHKKASGEIVHDETDNKEVTTQ